PVDAATHYGHDSPPYRLLLRRWHARYVRGAGELLRGALGQPHMRLVLRGMRELRIYAGVLLWWAVLASVLFWPLSLVARSAVFAALAAAPYLLMLWRKRSASRALYSVVSWCFNAAGLALGLVQRRRPPKAPIPSRVLHEPPQSMETRHKHYA
ncbi:MAG: glycosyl transferase, partial [Ramlibacter sp.]